MLEKQLTDLAFVANESNSVALFRRKGGREGERRVRERFL